MLHTFSQLTSDTTLLTPNRRLSAVLLKQYHHWQTRHAQNCWHTPNILPLSAWLQRLWKQLTYQQCHTHPLLLNATQEYALWEKIISESPANNYLLQVTETVKTARAAWELLKQWQLNLDHPAFQNSEDYAAFQDWARQFAQQCKQQQWLDQASLPHIIVDKILDRTLTPVTHILLVGFTELTPMQNSLFNACKQEGSKVSLEKITGISTEKPPEIYKINLKDRENEIHTMARWTKAIQEQASYTLPNREITIGCIIPNLEQHRDIVVRIFSAIYTEQHHCTLSPNTWPFNISAGIRLSEYPIIYTAIELLKLAQGTISLAAFSHVLRSPFLAGAETEMTARAQLENYLRQRNITNLSIKKIISDPRLSIKQHCPILTKKLLAYCAALKKHPATALANQWATLFMQLLQILGWPGERSMNSQEYQITHTWLERMAEYNTLDHVLPPQDFEHALHQLIQMTKRTIYQPQSPEVSVQILGVLEAIDLPFDYLWIMNFDDQTWPPAPKPNAFIPKQLQKTLNLPHATAEREFTYCQQLTEKLTQAAPHIIFSHAIKNEEIDLRSSPLIESIPTLDLTLLPQSSPLVLAFSPYTSIPQRVYAHKETEFYTDEQGPPVTSSEKIHGGVTILKQQAACPFKAFSELRLYASALETPTSGLRPQERGTVIHKALELIWKKLCDQHALIALDDSALQTLIQQQVDSAIQHVTGQSNLASRYLQLESARAQKLLWEWLQLEKTRPPFTVIATEYAQQIQLGELTLHVRVDRIDKVNTGKQLIIDYKTGKTQQISHWFGNRPEEPQLPVYCLTNPTDTIGIAFAQIYPGELQLKGVSKVGLEMKSIKTLPEVDTTPNSLWEQQLLEWQTVLYKLSLDFQQGQANVDPKDKEQTCRLCNLQSLCRIYTENAP